MTALGHSGAPGRDRLPFAVLLAFLALVGTLVFFRVQETRQEPFFDVLSYAAKAKAFWDAAGKGNPFNPFDLEPAIRPPGTVLFTYPFGFSDEYHGFYFRTVFLPVALFALALWMAGKRAREREGGAWLVLVLAVGFSSLPLFYQFEPARPANDYPWPTCWGLVDTSLGAVAALAAALVARGVPARSTALTAAGIVLAAFCLFLKPAGLLVMGAVFLVWVFFLLPGRKQGGAGRYAAACLAAFVLVYGAALSAALFSRYLSPATLARGGRAVEILVSEWPLERWGPVLLRQVHFSVGLHWLLFLSAVAVLAGMSRRNRETEREGESPSRSWIPATLAVLGIGLWFWLVATGKSQVRYFYPFLLMAMVLVFPPVLEVLGRAGDSLKKALAAPVLLPPLLLLLLLLPGKPFPGAGPLLGVHVDSGGLSDVAAQAGALVGEARKRGKDLVVYLPSEDYGNAVFAGVGGYRRLIGPGKPSFFSRTAIRWDRPPVIVLAEMAAADFILFEPVSPPSEAARVLEAAGAPDFLSEKRLVRSWLTGLDPSSSGVAIRSETSLSLLEITDRERFSRAVDGLRDRGGWRKTFEEANPRRWLTAEGTARMLSGGAPVAGGVRFGGRFSLEGLVMRRDGNGLVLDFFWRSLTGARLDGIVFLHVVDAGGAILAQGDYGQDPGKRTVPKDAYWRDRVRIPEKDLKGATALALGIYGPPDLFLPPDGGRTDWGGKRLVVPLEKE
jgi:hypothetical protein